MPVRARLWSRLIVPRTLGVSLLLIVVVIAFVLGWRYYNERQRRELLIQAVQQAGGSAGLSTPLNMNGRVLMFLAQLGIGGTERYRERCDLLLNGEGFNDGWMEHHHQLRGLPLSSVIVVRSQLSPDGLCRLVQAHELQTITAPGMPLTDDHAEVLASQADLRFLNLNRTQITDAAIPLLKPQQLGSLYVGGTHVTASGLEPLRDSMQLRALGLDGRQFSEVSDDLLNSIRQLRNLVLIGPEITDEHLARVARMTQIDVVYMERSSVTSDGAARFREERPDCRLQMPQPGNEVIPWQ